MDREPGLEAQHGEGAGGRARAQPLRDGEEHRRPGHEHDDGGHREERQQLGVHALREGPSGRARYRTRDGLVRVWAGRGRSATMTGHTG